MGRARERVAARHEHLIVADHPSSDTLDTIRDLVREGAIAGIGTEIDPVGTRACAPQATNAANLRTGSGSNGVIGREEAKVLARREAAFA